MIFLTCWVRLKQLEVKLHSLVSTLWTGVPSTPKPTLIHTGKQELWLVPNGSGRIKLSPHFWHDEFECDRTDYNILKLWVLADLSGAKGIGLYKGRLHVDQRPTEKARWIDKSWAWKSDTE